jgi:alanyl-tRNA synthetase
MHFDNFYFDIWNFTCLSGTHISNTRDAKSFALLSEEGIAKGVRRITAVTAGCASQAMELASSIDFDINEASQLEGAVLEKVQGYPYLY